MKNNGFNNHFYITTQSSNPNTSRPNSRQSWQHQMDDQESQNWQSLHNTSTLFFDGASKGNLSVAGAGGSFWISKENWKQSFLRD
jgi:hypothetical protein